MPPRHAYWTILVDDQPTAFRAHDAEELLPTLNRLKQKNGTAVMKWFERGQLWDSREAAHASPSERESRDRNWRPGGEHRDPRQPYKDAKKARWQRFKQNVRGQSFTPPHGDPFRS